MNLTISPQIRIVALIGVIVIVVLGGAVVVLGRSHATPVPSSAQRHGSATPSKGAALVHSKTHATTAPAHTKPKTAVTTATPATPAKKTAHTTAPKTATTHKASVTHKASATHKTATHKATTHKQGKTLFRGNPVYADLPAPLQWQLAHHKIVVVSFYDPNANVDSISVAEAHAGAVEAGAGFLLVSVLDNKVAGILTALLPDGGLLPEPGVIIYRAPGIIVMELDGFTDRDTVAQAASNALTAPAAAAPPTTTTPAVATP